MTSFTLAPPPMSRKLAGDPPCSLMMSMVAIARPAPFTGYRGEDGVVYVCVYMYVCMRGRCGVRERTELETKKSYNS